MTNKYTLITFIFISALLSGCVTYSYNNVKYNNRQEAESAQKTELDMIAGGIVPRPEPIAPFATVVIPTKSIIQDRALKPGGLAESRDYVASGLYRSYKQMAELIKKRNIFANVEIIESADPVHVEPSKGEVVLYIYMPSSSAMGWYYISQTTKRTPLHFDSGNPDKVARVKYFLDRVEELSVSELKK